MLNFELFDTMSVKTLNPKAEVIGKAGALFMNINASRGLYDVMKSNLGPKGTIKMLVGGAGGETSSRIQTSSRSMLHVWNGNLPILTVD